MTKGDKKLTGKLPAGENAKVPVEAPERPGRRKLAAKKTPTAPQTEGAPRAEAVPDMKATYKAPKKATKREQDRLRLGSDTQNSTDMLRLKPKPAAPKPAAPKPAAPKPAPPEAGPLAKSPKKGPAFSLKKLFIFLFGASILGGLVGGLLIFAAILHYGRDLPDYRTLAHYEPEIVTRIHAGDGSLLREFAREPRLFVPVEAIPKKLVLAFVSAEDKNFYSHSGLDYPGLIKAQFRNIFNLLRGRNLHGGSTISQQVARNFLLTLDRRLDRKIKEMILTLRIERAFSKDQIIELYLNEINFGNRSYGVAAAALNYFNKSLSELTIAEMAYLAALPKAPNNYHPVRQKARAVARRNWVLSRMYALGHIDQAAYEAALAEDLVMRPREGLASFQADYFAEEVRRKLVGLYGEKTLYGGGLSVRTSLEPRLQRIAEKILRAGLVEYDQRHGYRGPLKHIDLTPETDWQKALAASKRPLGMPDWRLAIVLALGEDGAHIGLDSSALESEKGFIEFEQLRWARDWLVGERLGPRVTAPSDVLSVGDIIIVSPFKKKAQKAAVAEETGPFYRLEQIPEIQGALVAMDPHTGRVLAMVGGYDYDVSQFNRATQAKRQPGSAFKPFVYAAALENGFTPASLVLDAPFVMEQGDGLGKWKPKNSSNAFYGPSTLRLGIEKSRNLMTVRLAQYLGMKTVVSYADRFGLAARMEPTLASSLGASEVTLMELTSAYAMLVNGGHFIAPSLVDRIQDRRGHTVFKQDTRLCAGCNAAFPVAEPVLEDERKQIIDPLTAYQSVSMLEGVVQNGTGIRIKALGRPLAGKTGTTNDEMDAWFVGFSPDLAVGVFVGFDQPRSLGAGEEGASVAVPIFRDFMAASLAGEPAIPFRIPNGIRLVRINADTGEPARPGDKRVILESFRPGSEPRFGAANVLDGSLPFEEQKSSLRKGSGGIY